MSQVLCDADKKPPFPHDLERGLSTAMDEPKGLPTDESWLEGRRPIEGSRKTPPGWGVVFGRSCVGPVRRYEHHVLSRRECTTRRSEEQPR